MRTSRTGDKIQSMPVNTIINILLILAPALVIPLIMRFVISNFVLFFAKKKYIPGINRDLYRGWETDKDKEAIRTVTKIAEARLKYHFTVNYSIKKDIQEILLSIQNTYSEKKEGNLRFKFSVQRLIECSLLAFCDFYREYASCRWYKIIQNIRLLWFQRIMNINGYYRRIFRFPILKKLKEMRLAGKILRLFLVPLIGFPLVIYYGLRSVIISVLFEGFFRFLYGLVLIRFGYYALFLYVNKNAEIIKRIENIPKTNINKIGEEIEKIIDPLLWEKKSDFFEISSGKYLDLLKEFMAAPDEKIEGSLEQNSHKNKKRGKILNLFSRVGKSTVKSIKKQFLPNEKNKKSDVQNIRKLYREIISVYYPGVEEPFLAFRLRDVLEISYMASILCLHRIYQVPAAKKLLGAVSVDLVLKIKFVAGGEIFGEAIKKFGSVYKYLRLFKHSGRVLRIIRGISAPYTIIPAIGTPILLQQIQDLVRDFTYHRIGRILLYQCETSTLRQKKELHPILW